MQMRTWIKLGEESVMVVVMERASSRQETGKERENGKGEDWRCMWIRR